MFYIVYLTETIKVWLIDYFKRIKQSLKGLFLYYCMLPLIVMRLLDKIIILISQICIAPCNKL